MLNKLLSALNDCVWAYNHSAGEYVFVSPNALDVFGLSTKEIASDSNFLHQIIVDDDKEHVFKTIASLKPGDTIELYYRIQINGKIKWIFDKRSYFIDDAGNEISQSVTKDVTDQNTVQYHLRNSLGDFSILFDKNPHPMWIYEIPSLRIIKVNNAAMDHYGYSEDEFLDMTIRDVRPKLDLAAFNEYIFRKGITRGKTLSYNNGGIWRHQNKHGDVIYAEITGYEIKYNNTSCRIIVATDVTERVCYEQEKKEAEDMRNAE